MVWEWLKKNKGSPAFKFVIFILVLFIIRVSLLAFNLVNNNKQDTEEQSNTNYQSEQVQSDSEYSEDNASIFSNFDIHIGWSNIVVFVGLAAALAIIEKRKDKSSEQQKMSGSDNRKDE